MWKISHTTARIRSPNAVVPVLREASDARFLISVALLDARSREVNCTEVIAAQKPALTRGISGGSDGRRSRDLTIFSRALYQLSYRAGAARATRMARTPPRTEGFSIRDPDGT